MKHFLEMELYVEFDVLNFEGNWSVEAEIGHSYL